jgi:hypothetical protein
MALWYPPETRMLQSVVSVGFVTLWLTALSLFGRGWQNFYVELVVQILVKNAFKLPSLLLLFKNIYSTSFSKGNQGGKLFELDINEIFLSQSHVWCDPAM